MTPDMNGNARRPGAAMVYDENPPGIDAFFFDTDSDRKTRDDIGTKH